MAPPRSRDVNPMSQSEIDAIRALLSSKARPVGWTARRQRIEERTIDTGNFRTEAVDGDLALR